MRKAILLPLVMLLCASSFAQPRAKDFRAVTDSLNQRLKRRTGVSSDFKLDKLLSRGNELDFYYSQNFSAFPWRREDVSWFKEELSSLSKGKMDGYAIGHIFAGKQELQDLPMPLLGNDGKALPTSLRVEDPRGSVPQLVRGSDYWPKGLSGRHIALWQSHGRYWEPEIQDWKWQRSPNHRTTEDIFTQSFVVTFLMPMLENAGATVLCPRERDIQTNEVVCDNDPSFGGKRGPMVRKAGSYRESGQWSDAGEGFADALDTYGEYENPFVKGTARMCETTRSQSSAAKAVWRPDIPEKGDYAVYVSYKSFSNSTTCARYTVHHAGGETTLNVNQRMGGGTWIYLGTFTFLEGTEGYVELTSESESYGIVSADAVRFGGGMGKVERGGRISGLPAFVEGALYNMQYSGIDMALMDDWEREYVKDYAGRGKWVQEMAGGSRVIPEKKGRGIPVDMSLAWHTDAGSTPNDSIIGTLAIYTLMADRSDELANGESRMNGRLLSDLVQTQVVDDIRALYEPAWSRRQLWDRSYSECRTTGVPGMLLELLSHLNYADMRYGLDPNFRFTSARAVYKGILKYLSARYGCPYVVQPLPVNSFKVDLSGGRAVLSWKPTQDPLEPTAKAKSYRVYVRRDDGGFGEGLQIAENSCSIPMEEGHLYSFKVTACNEGGESFPSEILSAGISPKSKGKVLVVNNFTRVSAPSGFDTPLYAGFTDDLDSGVPWGQDILFAGEVFDFSRTRTWTTDENPGFGGCYTDHAGLTVAGNTFDFPSMHGRALMDAGYSFFSTSADAFDGSENAWATDIICGKQVTTRIGRGAIPDRFQVFTPGVQDALRRFTSKGGNVIISGAYIGTDAWDSIYQGVEPASEDTRKFVSDVLGYRFLTNHPDRSGKLVSADKAGFPEATYNREWSSSVYRVENPDGIKPASDKTTVLMYYSGGKIPAATLYTTKGYRVAAFGFPLETSPELGQLLKVSLEKLK